MMYGLVAKDIPRKMWRSVDGAQSAVNKEWRRLRDQDVWDEENPRGLWDVIEEAKRLNKQIHIGRLFDICVEKSSELEHNKIKHNGRVVFGGNNVRDEFGLAAAFPEMGSERALRLHLNCWMLCRCCREIVGNNQMPPPPTRKANFSQSVNAPFANC